MDEIDEITKMVHQTINDHKNKAFIECIEKKIEDVVEKVIYKRLQHVVTYVGKYKDDNTTTNDNADPTNNILVLYPVDIDPIHGE